MNYSNKKKVMIMTNSLHGGGAEKVLRTILTYINTDQFDITVYSMHDEDEGNKPQAGRICYGSVFGHYTGPSRVKRILSKPFSTFKGYMFNHCSSESFYRLFFHKKYDVEIAFIEGESTRIISGSNNDSRKYAWVHIDLTENPWTDFLYSGPEDEAEHYRRFDKVICVSESVRTAFLNKYYISQDSVTVQYNPIDRNEILLKSKESINESSHDRFRIITVGRLVPQKGYDRLVHIAEELKSTGYQFEWVILGDGAEKQSICEAIHDKGLEDCVLLLGYKDNPFPDIAESDLYVCTSRAEGFSTSVSEAIILGIPVVSTDCAGVVEIFGDEQCGMIVENDADALLSAVKTVMDNHQLLKGYHEACMRRAEFFSLDKCMREIEGLIND